jgi:hypothetical protein
MSPHSRGTTCPSFPSEPPSSHQEGAGKAGCPSHLWSACNKKARGRTTGTNRINRPSLRNGFNGLYVISSVNRAFLPPSSAKRVCALREFSASVGAPGPHDFAVRDIVIRQLRYRVHRIPLPTSVTIAKRPSYRVRDARMIALIWVKRQCPSGCGRLARRAINFAHAQFSPPPVGFAVLIPPIASAARNRAAADRSAAPRSSPC